MKNFGEPFGGEYGEPEGYVSMSPVKGPTLRVSIERHDNGWLVSLVEPPKHPPAMTKTPPVMEESEMIDTMIDGIGALLRHLNDHGAGDDWKGSDDREKLREAFKVMFPGIVSPRAPVAQAAWPRQETRVFDAKAALLSYLEKNL